jgi:hypothetical protein
LLSVAAVLDSLQETVGLPCAKAHGKGRYAHGKAFAVCRTRQTTHGIQASAKTVFAVCHISGTRQTFCRVQISAHGKKMASSKGDVEVGFPCAYGPACPKNVDNSKYIRLYICKFLHISIRIYFERETPN